MPSFTTAYIPRTLIYKSVTCSERAKNDQSAELRVHTNCLAEEPRVGGLPAPSNSKGRLQILHSVSVCTIWFISNCIRNGYKFPAKASLLVFGGALNAQMLSKILYEKVACHLLESIYVECVESACYCRHRCRLAFSWPRRTLVELLLSRCLCFFLLISPKSCKCSTFLACNPRSAHENSKLQLFICIFGWLSSHFVPSESCESSPLIALMCLLWTSIFFFFEV